MALPPGFVKDRSAVPSGFVREKDEDFFGAGVIEPARTIVSGVTRAIVGGLSGVAAAAIPGGRTGAEQVEAVQAGAFQPQTEAGQESLQTLGDLFQKGVDIANFPISGLGGLIELISGQGIDQAAETIKSVQEEGAGVTAGERVLEETGSPLLATAARVAPEGVAEILGLKGAGKTIGAAADITVPTQAIAQGLETIAQGVGAAFKVQTPTKQRIAKLIEERSTDVETARFQLEAPTVAAADLPESASKLPDFLNIGGPRVKTDRIAVEAINQGFDEGVIAAVKGASDADRVNMLKMVNIMERGKKNARFAALNRPSDIAGESLLARFRVVRDANKKAGSQLDGVAKNLKGIDVDSSSAVDSFINDLESMGVTLNNDLSVNFKGSDIEGLAAPEAAIKRIVGRMSTPETLDAFELHRLKRFIDEIVTFGKAGEGLAGKTEGILKSLRHNLDGILDSSFPDYDAVNGFYSETIGAIDALQDVTGKKLNLLGPNADKATGTLLRRLLSNAQSRVNLLDSVNEIESVANKFGGNFKDDLLTQILFVDELDSVFGPVARTSFQGQIRQAIPTSKAGLVSAAAEKATETIRGINPEAGFRAIRRLLQ